jgi:serine/threonine-protein kinase
LSEGVFAQSLFREKQEGKIPIVCQAIIDGKICGYSNPDGLDFCDDCGSDLRNQTPANSSVMDVESVEAKPEATPPQTPSLTLSSPPSPQGAPQASNPSPAPTNGHAKLVIRRNGPVGKTYVIDAPEIRLGRWDADNGHFPEIDLTEDDRDSKVSRSHAKITLENGQYFIEDLGSLNGTYVNRGKRLLQGQKTPLNHGDEIIMGRLFFSFEIGEAVGIH